jgi:hypothetical protein
MRVQKRLETFGLAIFGLLSGSLVATAISTPAHAECASEAGTTAAALQLAQQCQNRVEDLSGRNATRQLFVNPDGTFTAEETAQPRFVQTADKSWQSLDMTLIFNPDGRVGPKAAPMNVKLSGGGTAAPLLDVANADRKGMSLSWLGDLPKPSLEGSTAIYADVLHDVDLHVLVSVDGVEEVLVVKSPDGADKLASKLTSPISAPGMTVAADPAVGLTVTDKSGVQLAGGVPQMWDSSTGGTTAASADSTLSSAAGPGTGAKVAPMDLAYTDGQLTVTPDATMLASSDTRYPVYIDPTISKTSWTMINKTHSTQSYWSYDKTDCGDGVWKGKGLQCAKVGYTDQPTGQAYRSLFQFPTTSYTGKHVLSATFSIDELHSYSCTNSLTDVHVVNDTLGSGTDWSNDAGKWAGTTAASVSNNDCHDARVYTGFTTNALISAVSSAAGSKITLGMRARTETSTDGWKKFDAGTAKLAVTYNSYPNKPDTLTIDGKACGTGTAKVRVSTLGGHNPVLKARLSDPDTADHLIGKFTWTTTSGSATASQSNIANGQYAQVTASAATFADNTTYSYTVLANDGRDNSKASSGPCEFTVDSSAPAVAPTVVSSDGRYALPHCDGGAGWCDGVGKTGGFTFGAADVTDVSGFLYGWTNPPVTRVDAAATGGTATVQLTPAQAGLTDLYVRSVDLVGNLSPVRDYRFFVGTGKGPVGEWKFDDGDGATAADTNSGSDPVAPHPAALTDVGWTSSTARLVGSHAATFNGTSSRADTSLVVDPTKSFTVSAWVRLTDTSADRSVVTLDSTGTPSLYLQYQKSSNRWLAQMPSGASGTVTWWSAKSVSIPKPGLWTHLGAVYDAGAKRLGLYVNGVEEGSATSVVPFANPGESTRIGGTGTNWFKGDLSEVRVWDRAVIADEFHDLAAATQVADWEFDDSFGTQAADNTPFAHAGTLEGGAAWSPVGHNNGDLGSISLNGFDSAVTSAQLIHTDQSFSVAAWVQVSCDDGDGPAQTVLGQDGGHASAFELAFSGCPTTKIKMNQADAVGTAETAVNAVNEKLGAWVQVTAVYDAGANTFTEYLNGVKAGSVAGPTKPWDATGRFAVGRDLFDDAAGDWFPGAVDAVHVYQGVLTPTDIQTLANS